jgi:predicted alpha/beta hydrolase family esterase
MYSATFYITKVLALIVEACIIEGNTVQLQLIVADQHPKQITWNHLALKKAGRTQTQRIQVIYIMKNALIVHDRMHSVTSSDLGFLPPHQSDWYPWVQSQLKSQGIVTAIPELPDADNPNYEVWNDVFSQEYIDNSTALIGHGLGAGFLLRWLSENPGVEVNQLALVGPWHQQHSGRLGREFLYYDIDKDIAKRVGKLTLLSATDGSVNLRLSSDFLLRKIEGIEHHRLTGFGKFLIGSSMKDEAFPELLDVIKT